MLLWLLAALGCNCGGDLQYKQKNKQPELPNDINLLI